MPGINIDGHVAELEAAINIQKTYRGHVARRGNKFDRFLTREAVSNGAAVVARVS